MGFADLGLKDQGPSWKAKAFSSAASLLPWRLEGVKGGF